MVWHGCSRAAAQMDEHYAGFTTTIYQFFFAKRSFFMIAAVEHNDEGMDLPWPTSLKDSSRRFSATFINTNRKSSQLPSHAVASTVSPFWLPRAYFRMTGHVP